MKETTLDRGRFIITRQKLKTTEYKTVTGWIYKRLNHFGIYKPEGKNYWIITELCTGLSLGRTFRTRGEAIKFITEKKDLEVTKAVFNLMKANSPIFEGLYKAYMEEEKHGDFNALRIYEFTRYYEASGFGLSRPLGVYPDDPEEAPRV